MDAPRLRCISLLLVFVLALHPTTPQATDLIQRFRRCSTLNEYFVHALLPHVGPNGLSTSNAYIDTQPVPRGYFNPNVPGGPAALPLKRRRRRPLKVAFSNLTALSPDAEERDADGPAPGVDFSTTNVQVRGVDEPDIVKTDGRRVFTLSGDILSVVQVLEKGRSGRRVGKLKLPTYPQEMLIEGDYLLMIGSDYDYRRQAYTRYGRGNNKNSGLEATTIHQVHVVNGVPRLRQTLQLEGGYIRARETDGIARIVLQYNPLASISMFYPSGRYKNKQTKKWNREIIKYSRPGMWLPTYTLRRGTRLQTGVYTRCIDIFRSGSAFSGFNILTVVTLPVSGLLSPKSSQSIISNAEKVYSTKNTMYVTTSEFRYDNNDDSEKWGANYQTEIHKFTLSDSGAKYVASGSITGSVINQFAMHEWNNVLYIATTDGAPWWGNRDLSASKMTSFRTNPKKRRLYKVGEVGNLGVGERIFAVRYRWDTAYVVTFREVDPLYIIDISKPDKLRVTGELKIPGFSSYLHNVGPGRILGVGQEATLTGRTTGAKVSLFDVSDKSNPKELSSWSLKGSYSDAEWDHRAFLWWRLKRIAVMPVNVYSGSESFSGAIVLDVSADKITERGRVTHKFRGNTPSIKRNAIIGRKYLWSMSEELLQVNDVDELKKVEAKVQISS